MLVDMNAKALAAVQTVIIAAATSTLSCVAVLWLVGLGPRPEAPPLPGNQDAVLRQLSELRVRLDDGFDSLRQTTEATPVRQAVSEPHFDRLDALALRVEQLVAALSTVAAVNRSGLPRWTPENWAEVDAFMALRAANPDAAEKSVSLLTPHQVVARFGFPTKVVAANARGGGMCWTYARLDAEGKETTFRKPAGPPRCWM